VPEPLPLDEQRGQTFPSLVELMQRLLAPDGCPWDREQTYASLRQYVIEEAAEVVDAIDGGRPGDLAEELGDLGFQVVFLSEIGRKNGDFGPDDVIRSIVAKLVRRHPHVFGDVTVSDSGEVLRNWDAIKREEKKNRPLLDGVPRAFPALLRATRYGEKVAKVGFDWPDSDGSREKVKEELGELDAAVQSGDREHMKAELGDLLFAIVNYSRHLGISAEEALQQTSDKFRRRFDHVERRVREVHGGWPTDEEGKPTQGRSLEELDGYWLEAKQQEAQER
jgi:tetrapyrrole methylase family protein/MazG family protein/ATP diphosphatase